ncbi:retrotransposable element Tf2, partial [Tanacetum coccineum]
MFACNHRLGAPLTNLLQKNGFKWEERESTAFEALKYQLSTTSVLGLPDFEQPFIVEMDASAKEDEEPLSTSFMAMSQLLVGLLRDLKEENETLEELLELHRQLDRG